jgi:hypothetical protein
MENRNFEKHTFASVLVKESLSAITGGAVVSTFANSRFCQSPPAVLPHFRLSFIQMPVKV